MFWCSLYELDLSVGLIGIIVYGLMSLRYTLPCMGYKSASFMVLNSTSNNGGVRRTCGVRSTDEELVVDLLECEHVVDVLLSVLNSAILWRLASQRSFESTLLLVLAYVNQACMLHSCDLVSFYVCLEGQNFCFLVLSGLQNRGSSVESCLKYLVLSAFSSGMCLYWFGLLYMRIGMSSLLFNAGEEMIENFQILLSIMFKLGTAPLHLWVVQIYQSISKTLLMYVSTAPKLSLFCFWVSAWHQVWTDFSLALLVGFSMLLGSLAAFGQPALRALFAYSTINEIGLMLLSA